ncbi:HET-domain-containing protein [Lizonia empirigonia]|nr:HET-domain-containing protein [Lizonia empirigonia]
MRLLYTTSGGSLRFTEDLIGDNIPPYAILSHTWKEGQEVTFDNLKELNPMEDIDAQSKEGYRKIRFCSSQAKLHGLEYFWVDTYCIDKSNSSELQEAINSMFRWYRNAKRCYVYLSDAENGPSDGSSESSWDWEQAFRTSRWFKRGWTLQELLAPSLVKFFSSDGARLGDKDSLKHIIHQITQIPVEVLAGSVLSAFSAAERFSWAENRRTTREEDGAYCLLGIFGIHMSLIYAEGRENAFKRLQKKVEDFCRVPSWLTAPDPSTNLHKAIEQRQAETGLWLLESAKFEAWKQNEASRLWLYGIPGCGKTILSSALIEHLLHCCHADVRSATAYFYFDFSDVQKQDPGLMLCSLIAQLQPHLMTVPGTLDALITSCSNGQQQPAPHVLLEILRQTIREIPQVYVVLDALDECSQPSELLEMLTTVTGWQLQNLHVLMTSRKERDIEDSLASYMDNENAICLQSDIVDKDIHRYVEQRLSDDQSLAKWRKDATVK